MDNLQTMVVAKVCHDIATPLGALGMGIELLEDLIDQDNETFQNIKFSLTVLRERLELYRKVFGTKGDVTMADCERELKSHLASKKIVLHLIGQSNETGSLNYLFILLILQSPELLPYGGDIKVDQNTHIIHFSPSPKDTQSPQKRWESLINNPSYRSVFANLFENSLKEYGFNLSFEDEWTFGISFQ